MTPAIKGSRSSGAYLTNLDFAEVQHERDEVLSCSQDDIRRLAGYLDAVMAEDAVCVVGNGQSSSASIFPHSVCQSMQQNLIYVFPS